MLKKTFFLFLLFTFSQAVLHAQWVQTNGPSAGIVNCLAVSGTDLFAGTDGGGVYRSTNNGINWTTVNSGLTAAYIRSLIISGTNLYAGTNGGVYRSTNNGTNWTQVNSGLTDTNIFSLTVSGTNLFTGTIGGTIFLSTNNGTSWTTVSTGLPGNSVCALAVSGTNLFAGTNGGGVYLSTNNGTSWTEANTGLTDIFIEALAVSGTNLFAGTWNGSGVFLSTNNGTSWTEVNTGLTSNDLSSFAVSGTNLFAGTWDGGGVFLSTNNGTSWTEVNSGLTNTHVYSLAVSGTNLVAGTGGDGVFIRPLSEMITSGGSISGIVYNDLNGNGIKNIGETELSGWTIQLSGPANAQTVTDSAGAYSFKSLINGTYIVSEVQESAWVQTYPRDKHSVRIFNSSTVTGINFGNKSANIFTGANGIHWCDNLNWSLGHEPDTTDAVIIPTYAYIDFPFCSSDMIRALEIVSGGQLVFPMTATALYVKQIVRIQTGGSIIAAGSEFIRCYGDWVNHGNLTPGTSTITFTGNKPKAIDPTTFYNLIISGDSTSTFGNVSANHQLRLDKPLTLRSIDTIFINNDSLNGIDYSGTGKIKGGSINRKIRPGETEAYSFDNPNTSIQFYGTGAAGFINPNTTIQSSTAATYPTAVTVGVVVPLDTPKSFRFLKWLQKGGTVDTANNTITVDSVGEFSKWVIGTQGAGMRKGAGADTFGTPTVKRIYKIKPNGGSGFLAQLKLHFESGEFSGNKTTLQLLRGPVAVNSAKAKWNMVSLPVTPENFLKSSIFPSSISHAFTMSPSGYAVSDTLQVGKGYWLKFPSATTVQILGDDNDIVAVNVVPGWNMVGTSSYAVTSSSFISEPANIVASNFFGYRSGYYVADTLEPMRGYWVKANQAGKLYLGTSDTTLPQKTSSPMKGLDKLNILTLLDESGGEQSLYFGAKDNFNPAFFTLPPRPPKGVFDARFTTDRFVEVSDAKTVKEVPITVSSATYPLTISWEVKNGQGTYSLLIDGKERQIRGKGSVTVTQASSQLSLKLLPVPQGNLPTQYALEQNYPNPFNPNTTIKYQLPVESKVTLRIYNVLGQVIRELVNEVQDAGIQSAEWNASGVASGIYFYRIETASLSNPHKSFVQVRKMLLLK